MKQDSDPRGWACLPVWILVCIGGCFTLLNTVLGLGAVTELLRSSEEQIEADSQNIWLVVLGLNFFMMLAGAAGGLAIWRKCKAGMGKQSNRTKITGKVFIVLSFLFGSINISGALFAWLSTNGATP